MLVKLVQQSGFAFGNATRRFVLFNGILAGKGNAFCVKLPLLFLAINVA